MMIRSYFKFALFFLTLMIILSLLIRAQPYDDSSLRALVMPEGCPAPCFMGIRPGVTTLEDAIRILRGSAWVAEVQDDPSTVGLSAINWTWSKNAPSVIRAGSKGLILAHTDVNTVNIVDRIRIETTVSMGYAALLLYGEATPIKSGPNGSVNQAYFQTTDYRRSLLIWSVVSCPVTKRKFLDAQARIDFDRQYTLETADGNTTEDYWCWRHYN